MKFILAILLITTSFVVAAQPGILRPEPGEIKTNGPVIFVDSVKLADTPDILGYLNPNDILNISVQRDKYPNGALYITLKKHEILEGLLKDKFLSLRDILNTKVAKADRRKRVLYFLDDKLLTDTTNIRIPSKQVNRVIVNKASDMAYFKLVFPDMLIVRIFTRPEVIYIRGERKAIGHGLM